MKRKIFILVLFLSAVNCYPETLSEIINTYTILSDTHCKDAYKKLLPDFGVFNVLIITETVDKKTPLYKIVSQMNIEKRYKKKILENITDGILKIYFDLGKSKEIWINNCKIFEEALKHTGDIRLSKPPDFIILSHAHWTNYLGGLEYFQKKYPYIPIFITPDMKEGLICFDYDKKDNYNWRKFKNGRIVKIKNPVILSSGITILSKHLAIITQKFRHPWSNISLENSNIKINFFKKKLEYENILTSNTKKGIMLFTTCLHSSLLEAMKKAKNLYHKDIYLYSGGFEEELDVISKAKKISPPIKFYLYHCAPVEKLISIYGSSYIKRIKLGDKISFELE